MKKNIVMLYVFICVFILPASAMEYAYWRLVGRNYVYDVSKDMIGEIAHQLVNVSDEATLFENCKNFLLVCKQFNMIGKIEFINHYKILSLFAKNYKTKMHIAARFNSIRWTGSVLAQSKNAWLIREIDEIHSTPLHDAALAGSTDVARLLINFGADINAKNMIGMAPIHLAVAYDKFGIVQLLLEKKVNILASNNARETALNIAMKSKNRRMISVIWQAYPNDVRVMGTRQNRPVCTLAEE
ncbi:MAG: ankyrin repeat domain-containing protein [Candidatus Babeliaceae bacterium]